MRQAKLVFMWSRIRTAVDLTSTSEVKLRHLSFQDFLEALVRLAMQVPLPTDDEIGAMGASDAGEFMMELRAKKEELRSFAQARKRTWNQEPAQHVSRCERHELNSKIIIPQHTQSALLRTTTTTTTTTRQRRRRTRTINKHNKYLGIGGFLLLLLLWEEDFLLVLGIAL